MNITVTLYGQLQQVIGHRTHNLTVDEGSRAQDVLRVLSEQFPAFASHVGAVAVSSGDAIIPLSAKIREGDDIGLMPPVCGG